MRHSNWCFTFLAENTSIAGHHYDWALLNLMFGLLKSGFRHLHPVFVSSAIAHITQSFCLDITHNPHISNERHKTLFFTTTFLFPFLLLNDLKKTFPLSYILIFNRSHLIFHSFRRNNIYQRNVAQRNLWYIQASVICDAAVSGLGCTTLSFWAWSLSHDVESMEVFVEKGIH